MSKLPDRAELIESINGTLDAIGKADGNLSLSFHFHPQNPGINGLPIHDLRCMEFGLRVALDDKVYTPTEEDKAASAAFKKELDKPLAPGSRRIGVYYRGWI